MDYQFILLLFLPVVLLLLALWKLYENNRYKDPDVVLKDIEKYKSEGVPEYVTTQALEKAITIHPGHRQLIEKLHELKR